jgi:GNAT superfamily N-acetyltransferase
MTSKTTAFAIREATPADAPALANLRDLLFRELGRQPDSAGLEFRHEAARAFAEGMERGTCHAWIATSADGDIIASVAMLLHARLPSPESALTREGYLLNVYTAPEWRRRGVAAALVAASIARARELGLGRIRLHATDDGMRVYEKAGFKARIDEMELRL